MNKLLLAPLLCFSTTMLAPLTVTADTSSEATIDAILKNGRGIQDLSDMRELLPNTPSQEKMAEYRGMAQQIFRKSTGDMMARGDLPANTKLTRDCSERVTYIFISYSLKEDQLNEIMSLAAGRKDIKLVMRGIPPKVSIGKGVLKLQKMAKAFNPMPQIELNPVPFQQYGIDTVPSMVLADEGYWDGKKCNQSALITVRGLHNPEYIERSLASNDVGDHGVKGPVEEIAEPDLIEMMKQKVAAIDWEQKKKAAIERSWQNLPFEQLTAATKDNQRRVEASVALTRDLKDVDGKTLLEAGTIVNPLQQRPWLAAYVVFDGRSEKKVEQALRLGTEYQEKGWKPVYMFTKLDDSKGWKHYKQIQDHFNGPVYMLTPEVKSRFELKVVPSVITADSTHFIVDEYKSEQTEVRGVSATTNSPL